LGTNLIAHKLWLCQNCGCFLLEGDEIGRRSALQLIEKTDEGRNRDEIAFEIGKLSEEV
jgi:hypothetical protein